ncbi:helix-turn-helix transcriptional regulator [Actinoplanes ianthinogenes]|uniref:Helix-turn-helix transcriptional regulator n=1 Tax=Actinoplanes ianthinogenes TaxID=122358 RepID=A0ABN6C8U7_9ACTN|nr:LuxR family transcriptional regulator [Actinoplanes ianthinogenes]BCJ41103.1 helix-turn-helix transcriptional regulator [Actinoplanes ianthinogenes]GGR22894.1 helix-turn-helix transcriptional regulator [Actinoplanes ianthinogenes]
MSGRIVGRARELAVLHQALDDTKDGRGGCHVIFGPPGIGKSRLLLAAGDHADERDIAVAAREAFRHDLAAPLVTLAGALRACSPPTGDFAWLAGADDHPTGNYAKIHRLRDSLERFAAAQPLLIVIDDAHWMDELSALAVRELVPALASFPVRWLLASRTQPADTPGGQTLSWLSQRGTPIHLDVLDEQATEQLCTERIGARVDNTVLALVAGCGGYPLRIEQLLDALVATKQIMIADGIATVVGEDLPSSFVATVREIVGSLSADAQRLLRSVSVLDRPFDIESGARLMGSQDPAELFGLIDEVTTSGLLVEDQDGLTFRHALVHQAVQNSLGNSQAQLLHGKAAVLAREHGRPTAEIAGHLLRSGRVGAGAAVDMLRGTAAGVAATAPATAADLMLQALQAIGEHDPARPGIIADTVGLLASAGRVTKAHELGIEALRAELDPATRATVQLGLAEAFKHAGQNAKAAAYAEDGLNQPKIAEDVRAWLHAIRAHAAFYLDDLTVADAAGAEAGRIGREHEPGAAVFGLTARSLVAGAEGRLEDALTHATEATELADTVRGPALHRHPRIWLANALTALDRFEEAEQALRHGRQESDALGTAWAQPLWHYYWAALLTARGRLDDAVAEADAGVTTAEQLTAYQLAVPLLGTLIKLAVLRGDLDQGRALLDRMRELLGTGITAAPEDVLWPEAALLLGEGATREAFALLPGLYDTAVDRPTLIVQHPGIAATLVRLAVASGDPGRAEAIAASAAGLARRNPQSHAAAGAAEHTMGVLGHDPRRLQAAVARFRLSRRPLALAAALADAAELARATGAAEDRAAARGWYDEALGRCASAGAHGLRRQLEAGLGASLGAVRPERPPDPHEACLPGLSPAERPVALLVAQGMTNIVVARQLNLSPHTVDSHLRKIFMKLDIRSRVELAALVARECRC